MNTSATLPQRRIKRPCRSRKSNTIFRHLVRESVSTATMLDEFSRYSLPQESASRTTTVRVRIGPGNLRFEEEYSRLLQKAKGRLDNDSRIAMRRFWTSSGEVGAEWLVSRLNEEFDLEAQDASASILADIGLASTRPILRQLKRAKLPREQAAALLKAIGWIPLTHRRGAARRLYRLLPQYLAHQDPETREAAAMATRCLPRRIALELLNGALARETVPAVFQLVEAELSDRS